MDDIADVDVIIPPSQDDMDEGTDQSSLLPIHSITWLSIVHTLTHYGLLSGVASVKPAVMSESVSRLEEEGSEEGGSRSLVSVSESETLASTTSTHTLQLPLSNSVASLDASTQSQSAAPTLPHAIKLERSPLAVNLEWVSQQQTSSTSPPPPIQCYTFDPRTADLFQVSSRAHLLLCPQRAIPGMAGR